MALVHEPLGELRDRVAHRVGVPLGVGAVHHLVVGEGVRVGTDHLGVHQRRALPLPRVGDRLLQHLVGGEEVAAVDFLDEEVREAAHELGDRAAGGVHLDRDGDGVAVVLDEIDDGELEVRRGVERLPELALGGRAVTGRDEDDLIRLEPVGDPERLGAHHRLGGADGLEELRPGGGGGGDDVRLLEPPVRRHLPPAGVRVDRRADGRVEHLRRGHPEREAEGPVAVVGVEPVVARLEDVAGRREHRLVARTRDLEEDLVLPLELDLLVVDATRQEHGAVGGDELLLREPVGGAARRGGGRGHGWKIAPGAP